MPPVALACSLQSLTMCFVFHVDGHMFKTVLVWTGFSFLPHWCGQGISVQISTLLTLQGLAGLVLSLKQSFPHLTCFSLLKPRFQATSEYLNTLPCTTIADSVLCNVFFQASFYSLCKVTEVLWDVKYLCISQLTLPRQSQLMVEIR